MQIRSTLSAHSNLICMPWSMNDDATLAEQNGGYLRIAADQRWLQTVIRFRAWRRAKRRIFARASAHPYAGSNAQNSQLWSPGGQLSALDMFTCWR
jgi:hypothetical protein